MATPGSTQEEEQLKLAGLRRDLPWVLWTTLGPGLVEAGQGSGEEGETQPKCHSSAGPWRLLAQGAARERLHHMAPQSKQTRLREAPSTWRTTSAKRASVITHCAYSTAASLGPLSCSHLHGKAHHTSSAPAST